ncbi:MAG TPA: histidine kinase dimerization/phosphoacceptor domain -containing protein, partial [Puia sp.]|nr:histidine kinase dimerization/phosphoacceptor domain -containing protein [Puia sp.]
SARRQFENAIMLASVHRNKSLEAQAWFVFAARTPVIGGDIEDKISRYKKSLAIFESMGEKDTLIDIQQRMGYEMLHNGKSDTALVLLQNLLAKQQELQTKELYKTYYLLGLCHANNGNFNLAVACGLEAIKDLRHYKDAFYVSMIYSNLGTWNMEIDQPEKSIEYYHAALEYALQIDDLDTHHQFYYFSLLRRVVQCLTEMGRSGEALALLREKHTQFPNNTDFARQLIDGGIADCYKQQGNYADAEDFYLRSLKLALHNQRVENIQFEYFQIADLYIRWKKYDKAKGYVDKFMSSPSTTRDLATLKQVQLMNFQIDSASGDFQSAIRHYQYYKKLNDSIFTEKKSKQIEELQIQYNTAQKEQSILLLQDKEKLQQAELDKANFTKTLILIGSLFPLLLIAFLYKGYKVNQNKNKILQSQQDAINKKNHSLEHLINEKEGLLSEKNTLLEEKEWLLKEVHHRVKNNLQIVMSLLYSQTAHLSDEKAIKAFTGAQQRIHSIALMHQKLYQSTSMHLVAMKDYIGELVLHLLEGLNVRNDKVRFELALEDISLDISQAVPIGLVVNEAVTNALKYAFPGAEGIVTINFSENEDRCILYISDNGIGLPKDFDMRKSRAMGLKLIEGLCLQLEAEYYIESMGGVHITIAFPLDHSKVIENGKEHFNRRR